MRAPAKKSIRNILLGKIHIAQKDLAISDEDYREDILRKEFGVHSAAELDINELERLIEYFKTKGWQAKPAKQDKGQLQALREKAQARLRDAIDDERVRNPRGLVRSICGVDDVRFCHDIKKIKRLLAVLEKVT